MKIICQILIKVRIINMIQVEFLIIIKNLILTNKIGNNKILKKINNQKYTNQKIETNYLKNQIRLKNLMIYRKIMN